MSLATAHVPLISQSRHAADSAIAAVRGSATVDLALRHAGRRRVRLDYEIVGAADLPTVLVAGGISAGRHVAASAAFATPGWWDAQVGAGRPLDPSGYRIVSVDWLAAAGDLDCVIDPVDQADAWAALLDALGIARLAAVVGSSYGAMVGLQFAARHGHRLGRLVAISGVHRAHPYASAFRALQRQAVILGGLQCDQSNGLALARKIALLGYRTPEEFDARFGPAAVVQGRVAVAAEEYLDHCGASYAEHASGVGFLRLSESIDLQALRPEEVRVPVTVVAVAEDRLVPLADAFQLVERLPLPARLHVLNSRYGHDAFLKEPGAITAILREALARGAAA